MFTENKCIEKDHSGQITVPILYPNRTYVIIIKKSIKMNVRYNCFYTITESPCSSRSGSMSDDLSSESNVSFSKNEHRSLDFKLLLDEVKSGQQVRIQ